jgi:hypothetical protein
MRSIRNFSALCVALALALTLSVAASAGARSAKSKKKVSHPSKVTHPSTSIGLEAVGPDAVTGRVLSDDAACRTQRHVSVYRVNTGSSVPSGEFVAATWTQGDGSWAIPGPLFPSEFYAVVDAKAAKGLVCDPATSNSLTWG